MKKEMLIGDLSESGWSLQEEFFDENFCLELLSEARELAWKQAQVGTGAIKQEALEIRNDSIVWIDQDTATGPQLKFLAIMNDVMMDLNRELYLGLREFECHFAKYKPDGFYKKHLDQHQGSNKRVVSAIVYLNEPKIGGELVIYNRENPEVIQATIKPKAGSFVCFLSNQIYHEVLPTQNDRYSLTGWFRTL